MGLKLVVISQSKNLRFIEIKAIIPEAIPINALPDIKVFKTSVPFGKSSPLPF
jgi:hypothetical protein